MTLKPFKPFRALDILARLSHIENYLSGLHAQLRDLLKTESRQVVRETVSEVIDSSTGGGDGSSSGDATSIHGEAIDDTQPVDGDILTYDTASNEWEVRQWIDGSLGIGTGATPQARLHLPAGTSAANTAPLRMTAGSRTPGFAGDWNFSGTRLEFCPKADWRVVSLSCDHVTSTTTLADTTSQTILYEGNFGATSLGAGQTIIAHLYGRYSTANGTDTFTIQVNVGGSSVMSVTSVAAAVTDAPVLVRFVFTVRSTGATGTVWGFLEANINNVSLNADDTSTTVVDLDAVNDVRILVQWSAADPGNSFSVDQAFTQAM